MYRIALLGCDDDLLALTRAARSHSTLDIVDFFAPGDRRAELTALLPGRTGSDAWESTLLTDVDAVVVGRDRPGDRLADQADDRLRKLVQAGAPLIGSHPVCEAILALELEMIRRDTRAPLAVYYPGCRHPARSVLAERLVGATDRPGVGRPEQLLIDRHLADRSAESVWRRLGRDLHWLWPALGDVRQVSALAAGRGADDVANLSVQMTADSGLLVRWAVHAAAAGLSDSIVVVGSAGRATLRLDPDSNDWKLSENGHVERLQAVSPADELALVVEQLKREKSFGSARSSEDSTNVRSAPSSARSTTPSSADAASDRVSTPPESEWPAVARSLEVLDAATISLRRGRTIELPKTQVSEESTFKGVMSAAGCLLLLLAPLLLVGAAVIDRLQASFRPRDAGATDGRTTVSRLEGAPNAVPSDPSSPTGAPPAPRRFPWLGLLLAVPLVLFLLLQTLQLVFRPTAPARPTARSTPAADEPPARR